MKTLKLTVLTLLMIIAGWQAKAQNPVTMKEARKLAESIDSLAQLGQWVKIENSYFDGTALGERSIKDFKLKGESKRAFLQGVNEGLRKMGLFPTIAKQTSSFNLLRVRPIKDGYSVIYRIEMISGGFNYLDFLVQKNKKGEVKIADMYNYTIADYLSSVMSALLVSSFPDGEIAEMDAENEKTIGLLKAMTKAKNEGNYKKILDDYNKLSPENKKQKMFLGMRLTAAQQISMEEYKKAIDDYYTAFPDEPGLNLMLIDRYFMDENYPKCLEAVEKVDSLVGGDTYLQLYKGNIYTYMNDYDKAEVCLKKFLDFFPKTESAYTTYVSLLLAAEKYTLTIETLKKWEKETGTNPLLEIDFNEYEDFSESDEFKKYVKGRE